MAFASAMYKGISITYSSKSNLLWGDDTKTVFLPDLLAPERNLPLNVALEGVDTALTSSSSEEGRSAWSPPPFSWAAATADTELREIFRDLRKEEVVDAVAFPTEGGGAWMGERLSGWRGLLPRWTDGGVSSPLRCSGWARVLPPDRLWSRRASSSWKVWK